jgi:hypothetical protein
MTQQEAKWYLFDDEDGLLNPYPLTIVLDRYGGTYSKGLYLAFPLEYWDVPLDASGDDVECMEFWNEWIEPVGRGSSPDDALNDLIKQVEKIVKLVEDKNEN